MVKTLALGAALLAVGSAAMSAPLADLNVRYYGAKGDGVTDDTAAFQRALNAAGNAGGGIVKAPRGSYMIKGNLQIPVAVTLEGIFTSAPAHTGIRDKGALVPGQYGTTLLAVAGKGDEKAAPFISMKDNATLRGVLIYYPEQRKDDVPFAYPYCIQMRGNNIAVTDVELLNPYNGIDATLAHRHLLRNIQGQPLHIGVYVDQVYDIGRIENVHWNPWWSMDKKLFDWQQANGEAFIFGRTDWQYVLNTFCFGYKVGYHFIETQAGACNGNFLGIGADDSFTPVVVDQSAPFGLLITNGEFVSFHGDDPTMVRVAPTNTGAVRFVNCAYWGPNNQIAVIEGKGTVGFSDCTFLGWDRNKEGRAAIQAKSGTVLVRGCDFRDDRPQVRLDADVSRAVVTDNVVVGAVRVTNNAKNSNVAGNVGTK